MDEYLRKKDARDEGLKEGREEGMKIGEEKVPKKLKKI
jgi:hypothetical protein